MADGFYFEGGFTPVSFCKDVMLAGRVIEENSVDLVHVNGSRDHWVMATSNFLSAKKLPLVRTRQNTKIVKNNPLNRRLNQRLTDHTIVPCSHVKEMYAESSVFDGCEISGIHHGVEIENFFPSPPDPGVQKEFGILAGDFVIGMVGRLEWDKGHKYLFEAVAPLITGDFGNIKIIVVGFGPDRKKLQDMCLQLGIDHRVAFAGRRADMKEIISVFDIGAHPSIGVDTSSFAMKEMMAMEKPIVSSSYGGLKEIAEEGMTGYVVPPHDSDALRNRIVDLYHSRESRRKMGEAARKRVEREFTAEICARRTLAVYESTMQWFREKKEL